MKIVIDARILGTSTGVYVWNLLNKLEEIDSENEYVVLLTPKDIGRWVSKKPNFKVVEAPFKPYSFGEQLGFARLLRSLKPDLVHFTMPQQPLMYFGKRVTTVHDLTLVKFENIDMNPLMYKLRKGIFEFLLKNVVRRSSAVITPTQYVKKDLTDYVGKQYESKIHVTLEAGDPLADAPEPIEELDDKKFLFFVGNAFPYKNLHRLIEAYRKLQTDHPDLHLAMAGKKDYFYEEIATMLQKEDVKNVHLLGFISEGQKRWAFQNAESYVVASLSEGFHIPGLEAMYEGCPVVSSNYTCLPEVYESAAKYFDPMNVDDMVRAIRELLDSPTLRDELVSKGREQVKKYSWTKMAQQTREIYLSTLRTRD